MAHPSPSLCEAPIVIPAPAAEPSSGHKDTRKIYIVLSQTGTILSRILKLITREPYNHSSIALSEDLQTMYSFGRVNPYNPFWGGFVLESPTHGTFKRFKNTRILVLEVRVSVAAYDRVCEIIHQMIQEPCHYGYNYWGLFLAAVRVPFRGRNRYYCSEFVKYLTLRMGVPQSEKLPPIVKPMHFLIVPHKAVYEGKLREYTPAT